MRPSFYNRPVVEVAQDLIGCVVRHDDCAGVIVETEAYHQIEPASHSYIGLRERNRVIFGPPGKAYLYRSYGIHACLNAVCEPEGVGAAVLIRALEPIEGIELMRERRGLERLEDLCSGPGKLTQALAIGLELNGTDLASGRIVFSRKPSGWRDVPLAVSRRIGITKAVELPWRFSAAGSRYVSRPRPAQSPGVPSAVAVPASS